MSGVEIRTVFLGFMIDVDRSSHEGFLRDISRFSSDCVRIPTGFGG